MKKYLSLGAVLAGSALMVSCEGDDVNVTENTGVAEAIDAQTADLGTKPVAPIPLAQFPLTSLKLTFDNASGDCLGAAFEAGDELEIDFDSTDITAADDTTANGQADLDFITGANNIVFGIITTAGYVEDIVADPAAAEWMIGGVYNGTDNTGNLLLSELTLTPFAADLRSVTGRFTASAPVQVNINQDTENVVADLDGQNNIALGTINLPAGGTAPVARVTIYEDVDGNPAEVQSLDGTEVFETLVGSGNVAISVTINNDGDECVVNFAVDRDDVEAAAGVAVEDITIVELQDVLDILDLNVSLDVSPEGNQIPADTDPVYLISGEVDGGVTGSYRHDFDSSVGTAETIINSANEQQFDN